MYSNKMSVNIWLGNADYTLKCTLSRCRIWQWEGYMQKTAAPFFCHFSLKKEKNPFPPSPFNLKDLLLWSPAALFVCLSLRFSLCLSSSLCCTCSLITSRMSSCNGIIEKQYSIGKHYYVSETSFPMYRPRAYLPDFQLLRQHHFLFDGVEKLLSERFFLLTHGGHFTL